MPRLNIENVEIDSSVVAFYSSLYHDDIVVDKKISVSLVSLGEKHAFHFAVEIFYCRIRHDSAALRRLFLYLGQHTSEYDFFIFVLRDELEIVLVKFVFV